MAAKQTTTSSASPWRISPWSTNTQVSRSPIASWISTAATAESTPPDRPQITRALPTCARMRAIASSRKAAIVQSPLQAGDLVEEIGEQLRAVRRVHHFGMKHASRRSARFSSAATAYGAFSDAA